MDLISAQNNAIAKLPLLKQGDYEMWRLRIEQYIQLQDYALWEIIENGNSFIPVARTTTHADGTSTSTITGPLTAEERILKRNDVKARSILLMAIPNEHQLTFNQYKDAKTLFEAIQSSSESLDSIFNRLQKIVSQLSILGVNISQEDLNLKFLRCLPVEWNTHVVVWRNKPDLETMSIDDLYNNFKIVEQEVKGSVSSSSTTGSQNMAFVSTPGSTNEDTAQIPVSTASTPVSAVSTSDNAACLSDATVYAFLANQPHGSQIVHEDLEQIHDDDLEEMDLKWQLALLSMRAKKFYQRTGKKITINGGDTAGEQKSKTTRRTVNVEEASPKATLTVDGAGFDWSFMAEYKVPTNMALMAFSDSEVQKDKTCSSICLKSFETLKTQYDKLRVEYNKTEFDLANYKRALASVEKQLDFYKQNEVTFTDKIVVLKSDASFNEAEIIALKSYIEKLKKEKEDNLLKINNYDNATKSLDKVIGSQLFKEPEFVGYGVKGEKNVSEISSVETKKTSDAPIIEDWVSDCLKEDEIVDKSWFKIINVQQKPTQANEPRNASQIPSTARQSSPRAAVPISTARPVNTAAPKSLVNDAKNRTNVFQKRHSPTRRPVHQETALKNRNLKNKVNTVKTNSVNTVKTKRVTSAVGKKGVNVVKPSACWVWRPKIKGIDHVSKASGSYICKRFDYGDPQVALKDTRIFNSGCSRHMTGNKSFLTNYQEYDGGFVAFAGSSKGGKISGKGTIRTGNLDFEDVYFDFNALLMTIKSVNGMYCFKNQDLNQFCNSKGIKREYSNARTPQQNGVAERKNRTLIEAARTMVLVTKPHNKTPYELLIGRPPIISFMRPFGCPVSILNTLDHLGKFDEKADEGVLVGYSISSKAFRVYNHRTRKVEENLHVNFLENQPNIAGNGPKWLFDIDSLTNTMNYHPVSAGNRANVNAGIETNSDAGQAEKEKVTDQEYILLPLLHTSSYGPSNSEEAVSSPHDDVAGKKIDQEPANEEDHTLKDDVDDMLHQEKMATKHPDDARSQFEEECDAQLCKGMRTRTSSTNSFNTVRTPLNTASASRTSYPAGTSSEPQLMPIDGSFSIDINDYPDDPLMPELEDTAEIHSTGISAYDDFPNTPIDDQSVGAEADFHNMEPSINVSPIPTTRIHSIHPKDQIIGDPKSAVQTRRMAKKMEPKKVNQALDDVSWVEAMQEELLQFKLLNVWTLVDLPKGKKAIGTKWVFRNKKDQRGIVVRNKARLVAQGHRQEEGIDYDEVFAPVARIEAIRLFLAYASYMDFTVYQMDVKSAFLYGTIEEEVYVNQPPGFEDPEFPNKVYKVEKALYGLHQAPRAWYETLSTYLLENGFRRGIIEQDWVSDDEEDDKEEVEPIPKVEKKIATPTATKKKSKKKGIKRDYSGARTPQQNGVLNGKNRTLIEAARTMLADSKLPYNIWQEAVSNCFLCIQGVSESSTSSQQDQDCIVMPIWKDASYFDDTSLKSVDDAQIQDQVGTHDDCSIQDNGTDDQQVNTASPEVNTGSREVSTAVPEVNTATPEDLMGPIPTSEDTQVEDQIELGNLSPSYRVSSTPHTRIHKDHPIDHVIGDVQSSVQTRRMTTSYSELGFLGAIMKERSPRPTFIDLPKGHRAIGTKWVYRNKKDERGIVVQRRKKGIFISQDKYVHEILRKFNYTDVKSASTPTDLEKPLVKDADADDVDDHLYRSMIRSLMYLTASRPDIMFADSLLELITYTDSDYAGATLDRKSTTGGCQLLGNRLISWQCKKQTVVATSTTEAEYVAAANCCGQRKRLVVCSVGVVFHHTTMVTILPCLIDIQELASPEQTATALASPEQTAPGLLEALTMVLASCKINATIDADIHFSITEVPKPKITAWSSLVVNIAAAVICLATNRKFNFSRMIFEHMVSNISSPHKFLMYPRFIQLCLDMQRHKLQQHTRLYSVPSLSMKVFSNMKRSTKGFSEYHLPTPHDSPLHAVHSHGSDEGSLKLQELMNLVTTLSDRIGVLEADLLKTKQTYSSAYTMLILRVKKLESQIKTGKARRQDRVVLSDERILKKILPNRTKNTRSVTSRVTYNDIRPIFEKIWDFNQSIEPMDTEQGSGKQKSPQKSPAKEKSPEKVVEEVFETLKEVVKEPGAKRKKSIPRKSTRKRQKMEVDAEKEDLKGFLDIIPREEVPIEVESISTKFPIMDWKTYVLTETFIHDVEELYRLVKERYRASRPEGHNLMLWGDLHTLFEPNEDDEIWKNQHQYNVLSWSLYDFCGIHILLMENGMAIHMLTEKKYPLSQEMISKMLKKKLEVDHESSQAIELLRMERTILANSSVANITGKGDVMVKFTSGKEFKLTNVLYVPKIRRNLEIRRSSRIDDEVVQDQRQRDDIDLQDERQDQPKEEEVEPRRSKRARTKKSFGPNFVSFMIENEPTSYREAVTFSEGLNGKKPLKVK
ncbi:putative ribonuclease H-like domain-containing protein [Tanacetum coccineum]